MNAITQVSVNHTPPLVCGFFKICYRGPIPTCICSKPVFGLSTEYNSYTLGSICLEIQMTYSFAANNAR